MIIKEIYPIVSQAIRDNNMGKVIEMINSDNEILNMMTPFGTWLHFAASEGKIEIVKKLIELGLDVNVQGGTFNGGALNEASSEGHIEIAKYLLSCGAKLDVSDPVRNPLFGAVLNGHLDMVKLLIESGIDYTVKYTGVVMKNTDALAYARLRGQTEIVRYLESVVGDTSESDFDEPQHKNGLLDFITENYGEISNSIGEIIPGSKVAVTVHIIPASGERNYITLITTGMSDCPVYSVKEKDMPNYTELLIKLPPNWLITEDTIKDNNISWPLMFLRQLAHLPHLDNKPIGEYSIIPNGEPPKEFAENTKLSSLFVTSLVTEADDISKSRYTTSQGNKIFFYTLIPIYEEERKLAYMQGPWGITDKFIESNYYGVVDLNRENYGKI